MNFLRLGRSIQGPFQVMSGDRAAGFKRLKSVVRPASCQMRQMTGVEACPADVGAPAVALADEQKQRQLRDRRKRPPALQHRQCYNWFLAVRVSDPEVQSAMRRAQELVLVSRPELLPTAVPVSKAHLTLFLFDLDRIDGGNVVEADARVGEVCEAVREAVADYEDGEEVTLELGGVGHFNRKVLFAECRFPSSDGSDMRFARLRDGLGRCLMSRGLVTEADIASFVPHVTLMKMSRAASKKSKVPKAFSVDVIDSFRGIDFGTQRVSSLQLLSMRKSVCGSNYYYCHKEFPFAVASKDLAKPPDGVDGQQHIAVSSPSTRKTRQDPPFFSYLSRMIRSSATAALVIFGGGALVLAVVRKIARR